MTKYKFYTNIRSFIKQLKDDPINAQPSDALQMNGYDRKTLIKELVDNGIITKKNRIADKDAEGNFRTPVMKVRFGYTEGLTKEKFRRALLRMFINRFETNTSEELNEEDGGGAMGGATSASACNGSAPVQPMFSIIRRKAPTNEATATTTTGDYTYTAPVSVDKDDESLTRPIGGICTGKAKTKKRNGRIQRI